KVNVPVHVMHQATDTTRFRPVEPDRDLAAEVLFVGNSRGQRRPAVDWAIAAEAPITVYGSAWDDLIPKRYVKDTYFPNEMLATLYSSADILLNDHWPDMRDAGIISNRIFDALACGTFVLSDSVVGIEEIFGEAVPVFRDEDEFRAMLDKYRADPKERRRLATLGMEIVRRGHSFDARARQFQEIVGPLLAKRALTIEEMPAKDARAQI
ncbi:MAG: glycosyltransferase, partial [Actinobacteria bacterium]|nr:glycosyltransferase [Actinomycetota bacterium]